MFNLFPLYIYEQLHDKKLPVMLGECTDVGERAWRNRLTHHWQPTSQQEAAVFKAAEKKFIREASKNGLSLDECLALLAASPQRGSIIPLFTADLIYWLSPGFDKTIYTPAIEAATRFDEFCFGFAKAKKASDVDGYRNTAFSALNWLKEFGPFSQDDLHTISAIESKLAAAISLEELKKPVDEIAESMLLHVLSCWDVLFCSHCFAGKASAYPLFLLLMPRLSPSIDIDEETGKFSRNGTAPKRDFFEKSIGRLLDLVAVIIFGARNNCLPDKPVSLKEMSVYFNETERRLVKWRDESVHLNGKHFESLIQSAFSHLPRGKIPPTPWPLLAMAYLWSRLLVREDGKPISLMDCTAGYQDWWHRNLTRLQASGLPFGNNPWPAWLTTQSSGSNSLASWRSSQSSGRSSKPLDSQ